MVFPRGYAGDDNPRTLIIDSEMNMTRTNIPGTSPFEPIIGFSRAVRIGNVVHVSGTGPVGAEELSPGEQTRAVLDWEEIGRAHGEVFGEIRPAATMVVAALLNPKWRVEIEAEAVIP
jgi:enamine deaminase RidA (YjgF/YER057c/UK114 family)